MPLIVGACVATELGLVLAGSSFYCKRLSRGSTPTGGPVLHPLGLRANQVHAHRLCNLNPSFQVGGYLARHLDYASVLSKPIVVEEFGLARDSSEIDGPAYHPNATDVHRQRLYDAVFSIVLDSLLGACQGADGSAHYSGVSFWGWAGVGRPRAPGGLWRPGDNLIGDPPHEPQGWYSVYDTDEDIGTLLTATASRMETMCAN